MCLRPAHNSRPCPNSSSVPTDRARKRRSYCDRINSCRHSRKVIGPPVPSGIPQQRRDEAFSVVAIVDIVKRLPKECPEMLNGSPISLREMERTAIRNFKAHKGPTSTVRGAEKKGTGPCFRTKSRVKATLIGRKMDQSPPAP